MNSDTIFFIFFFKFGVHFFAHFSSGSEPVERSSAFKFKNVGTLQPFLAMPLLVGEEKSLTPQVARKSFRHGDGALGLRKRQKTARSRKTRLSFLFGSYFRHRRFTTLVTLRDTECLPRARVVGEGRVLKYIVGWTWEYDLNETTHKKNCEQNYLFCAIEV